MNKFHVDLVSRAVLTFAFPSVASFDEVSNLPFKEPPFRHVKPGSLLTHTPNEDGENVVIVSKKPEGSREILVGLVDRVDKHLYVYSMARNKGIQFVHPDDPSMPVPVTHDLVRAIQYRARTNKAADQIAFVYDVCRVYDTLTRRHFNVILSDLSPVNLPRADFEMLARAYLMRFKIFRPYTSEADIHAVTTQPEDFPYHPDNGVVFVQVPRGGMPNLRSACAKFTPPELATVFLHVNPIITLKTRVWQLSTWRNDHLEPFRTIPAPHFYIPPTGAVVAFRMQVDEDKQRWRLVPTRMRADKLTPSSPLTLHRFIGRYVERRGRTTKDDDDVSHTPMEEEQEQEQEQEGKQNATESLNAFA
jgi:hypothetical protein